jgi:DNA-binding beta-propeller fold protein YncE
MKGSRVGVVNAATCNATDTSGCGQAPAVVKVGQCTFTVAVSAATDTVYAPSAGSVASNCFGGDTVSVINGATCNGTDTAGCGGHFPVMPAGRAPLAIAVDTSTGFVYVADFASAAVSVLNGSRCNAETAAGCAAVAREQPVGSGPQGLAVNPRTRTVYVADVYLPGFLSIFTAARR